MPENVLTARQASQTSVNSEDLAAALGINQWNFQVQVPDGTESLRIGLHLIQQGTNRDLGHLTLSAEKRDHSHRQIPGPAQFRVLVMVAPVDPATVSPLLESTKLRVFAKEFQSGSASAAIIENPFRKQPRGVSPGVMTYGSARLVRDRQVVPDEREGFGTRYDLYSTDDNSRALRISFVMGTRRAQSNSPKR